MWQDGAMSDDPDKIVRQRLKEGEVAAAAEEVYRSYARDVRAYLRKRLSSDTSAEEVASDVFQSLMRDLPGFRGEAKLRTWLLTITRHAMLRHLERQRRDPAEPLDEVAESELAQPRAGIRSTHRSWLRRVMRDLDEADRSLLARWNEGWSWKELAELVGGTEESVRKRFTRLIKRLAADAPP
jgi:RNA polymerase sigma-70 factor (ECF subfamily)